MSNIYLNQLALNCFLLMLYTVKKIVIGQLDDGYSNDISCQFEHPPPKITHDSAKKPVQMVQFRPHPVYQAIKLHHLPISDLASPNLVETVFPLMQWYAHRIEHIRDSLLGVAIECFGQPPHLLAKIHSG
jgi:hypothetical protein